MKRLFVLLLSLLLLLGLSACGQAEAPAPTPTPEPTPEPTPVTTPATVLLDGVGAVAKRFRLAESVEIEGETEDCYVLSGGLLIEKWLVRPDGEADPAERRTYAANKSALYASVYCEGEPLMTFTGNPSVTVLDEFGAVLRVRAGGESGELVGYMPAADTLRSLGYYDGGGGGGGGGGSSDGGEISLTRAGRGGARFGYALLSAEYTLVDGAVPATSGSAHVLGEGAEGCVCFFRRGDTVRVLEKGEATCTVLLDDGATAELPAAVLAFEGGEAYEPWTGYAKSSAPFYHGWRPRVLEPRKLSLNTELTVVGVFGEDGACYIVELEGEAGLVPAAQVSETEIYYTYYDDGGGGGGGAEWSDPVL